MQDYKVGILEKNYDDIITKLSKIEIPQEKLDLLKCEFKEQIASPRRFENILTLGELLKILETRFVLSYNNISKLYFIIENIESKPKELERLIILHSHLLLKYPQSDSLTQYNDYDISYISPDFILPPLAVEHMSSEINKRSWKSFARALQVIKEKDIDYIEELDEIERTRKCLEIFTEEARHQKLSNPYERLLRALEIIGRNDIKEYVEKLLMIMFKEK